MRVKHVPQRTCIACRQIASKRDLVRVVRSPDGTIQIDQTGKKPGRGAYLCRRKSCWARATKGKQLEAALKVALSPADKAMLAEFAATWAQVDDQADENAIVQPDAVNDDEASEKS
ncbi:MAG: YlxR family protein [Chloroflexi bacterium]|nr:YlxR family protein [Chloroflexota bacterium]